MKHDEEFELFLAKYRWVFLRALRELRLPEGHPGDPLDVPERLLLATRDLAGLVKQDIDELPTKPASLDATLVSFFADDVVAELGTKLLDLETDP